MDGQTDKGTNGHEYIFYIDSAVDADSEYTLLSYGYKG